jgi:hypothetical protein
MWKVYNVIILNLLNSQALLKSYSNNKNFKIKYTLYFRIYIFNTYKFYYA